MDYLNWRGYASAYRAIDFRIIIYIYHSFIIANTNSLITRCTCASINRLSEISFIFYCAIKSCNQFIYLSFGNFYISFPCDFFSRYSIEVRHVRYTLALCLQSINEQFKVQLFPMTSILETHLYWWRKETTSKNQPFMHHQHSNPLHSEHYRLFRWILTKKIE